MHAVLRGCEAMGKVLNAIIAADQVDISACLQALGRYILLQILIFVDFFHCAQLFRLPDPEMHEDTEE